MKSQNKMKEKSNLWAPKSKKKDKNDAEESKK
jgi:hypothetical protein